MDFLNVKVGSYIFQFCNQKSVKTKISMRQAVLGKVVVVPRTRLIKNGIHTH